LNKKLISVHALKVIHNDSNEQRDGGKVKGPASIGKEREAKGKLTTGRPVGGRYSMNFSLFSGGEPRCQGRA